jgi:hypothetical protein
MCKVVATFSNNYKELALNGNEGTVKRVNGGESVFDGNFGFLCTQQRG